MADVSGEHVCSEYLNWPGADKVQRDETRMYVPTPSVLADVSFKYTFYTVTCVCDDYIKCTMNPLGADSTYTI